MKNQRKGSISNLSTKEQTADMDADTNRDVEEGFADLRTDAFRLKTGARRLDKAVGRQVSEHVRGQGGVTNS